MSLKTKANLVGDVSIMSITACFVLLFFSMFYEIRYVQIGIFALTALHYEMKMKYRELREKEIDEKLMKERGDCYIGSNN